MTHNREDIAIIDGLIIGYLANSLSESERMELEQWVGSSPENNLYFSKMQQIFKCEVDEQTGTELDFDAQGAHQVFVKRINNKRRVASLGAPKMALRRTMMTAASVAALALTAFFSYTHGEASIMNQLAEVVVEAPVSSFSKIQLPDGTSVMLNAGSKISYSQNFGIDNRNCSLEGEGLFEVAKDTRKPFIVETDGIDVEVLGTTFSVRNYENDAEAVVTLVEGSVEITTDHLTLRMEPNQSAVYSKESGVVSLTCINAQNATAWTKGLLRFDEMTLLDIAHVLERTYNIEVEFKSKEAQAQVFYGSFDSDRHTIQQILSILAITGKFNYEIADHRVIIK